MSKQLNLIDIDVLGIESRKGVYRCCYRLPIGWGRRNISAKEAQIYLRAALSTGNIADEFCTPDGWLRVTFSHPMAKMLKHDVDEANDSLRTRMAVLLLGC